MTVPVRIVHPSVLPALAGGAAGLAGHLVELGERAACRFDPELHVGPVRGESGAERAAREQVAGEVCADCPVWDLCLSYGRRVRPDFGVWVGLPSADLHALHSQVDVPTHPAGVA